MGFLSIFSWMYPGYLWLECKINEHIQGTGSSCFQGILMSCEVRAWVSYRDTLDSICRGPVPHLMLHMWFHVLVGVVWAGLSSCEHMQGEQWDEVIRI